MGFDALQGHPLERDPFLSSSLSFLLAVVVRVVHVFCQSKIGYFDDAVFINPKISHNYYATNPTRLEELPVSV